MAACVAVVLLHVSARPLYLYMQDGVGLPSWIFGSAVSSLTHWCVPVFVMLSGALLLGRPMSWSEAVLKRALRLLAVLAVSIVVYGLWRRYFVGDFQAGKYLSSIVQAAPYDHLFYLYVAIGLYVITPIISRVVAVADRPTLRAATIAACVISGLVLAVTTSRLAYSRDAVTIPWDYIGYFVLGYYLATYRPKAPYVALMVVAYVASLLWVLISAALFGARWPWVLFSFTYFSATTYAFAIGVFGFLLSLKVPAWLASALRLLAPLTLIVYLIHPMVLEALRRYVVAPPPPAPVELVITFVLTLSLSTVAAFLLRRIPGVPRLF